MKDTEDLFLDLQAALKHCGLDWKMILEDYYEYQKSIKEKKKSVFDFRQNQEMDSLNSSFLS